MPFDAEHFAPVRLLDRDPKTLTDPRERLEYLRDFLRELPAERFNMKRFADAPSDGEVDYISAERVRTDCGTTACIAGWCAAIFTDTLEVDGGEAAADLLALARDQAYALFFANADYLDREVPTYWDATPTQAANVLTHLLKTGEVDWSVA